MEPKKSKRQKKRPSSTVAKASYGATMRKHVAARKTKRHRKK